MVTVVEVCRCVVPPSAGWVHCRACCTSFQSLTLFDLHRVGTVDRRECVLFPTTTDTYLLGSGENEVEVKYYGDQALWATAGYQSTLDKLQVMAEARKRRGTT